MLSFLLGVLVLFIWTLEVGSLNHSSEITEAYELLLTRSNEFEKKYARFQTVGNRLKNVAKSDINKQTEIVNHAKDVRVIFHSKAKQVIEAFLKKKREQGNAEEISLYENMTLESFIERIIVKRPFAFVGRDDYFLSREGNEGTRPHSKNTLPLTEYLSYEEIAISALIGVSTPSFFINNGSRYNMGKRDKSGKYQTYGIVVGLVGARFENEREMESRFITNSERPSEWEPVYGKESNPTKRILKSGRLENFDEKAYIRRMTVTFETLLYEAERRAIEANKPAYVSVVGLGLGEWATLKNQNALYTEAFLDTLRSLELNHVAVVDFTHVIDYYDTTIPTLGNPVHVKYSKRNMADKIDDKYILIATYAWDANSYPGNEYWLGQLSASGDPAAAACSTIAELQNPLINDFTSKFIIVDAK